mgnify:FL=1
MKVNFYIWSNDKMEIKEEIVTRASLEIIKESDIPDYHGKDQLDFFKENIKDLEHKL